MRWIRKLLGLCEHRWVEVRHVRLLHDGKYYSDHYILRCDRCGEMKSMEF